MIRKFILLLFLLATLPVFSQQDSSLVLFRKAKELEAAGKRKEARKQMETLVQSYPGNLDFALFNALLKAFDHEFKTAIHELLLLQQKEPSNYDVLYALADVSRWDAQYALSLQTADSMLRYYPEDKPAQIKKVLVYELTEEYGAAEKILQTILGKNPADEEANALLERIRAKNYKQHIGAFYYNTVFLQDFAPWHFGGIEYMRKTKFAPVRAIASMAGRFGEQSLQLELEAYPKLGKKSYLYAAAGFSDAKKLFPDWRTSLELYRAFPHKWEASLGFRNLNYGNDINFVFTGTLGKYFPKYWIYYRSFARFGDETVGNSFSHLVHVRRYLKEEDRFVAISLIQGSNPMFTGWLNQLSTLKTIGAAADYQFRWKSFNLGKISFLYELEEYLPGLKRDRLTAMFTYLKRF